MRRRCRSASAEILADSPAAPAAFLTSAAAAASGVSRAKSATAPRKIAAQTAVAPVAEIREDQGGTHGVADPPAGPHQGEPPRRVDRAGIRWGSWRNTERETTITAPASARAAQALAVPLPLPRAQPITKRMKMRR